MLFKTPLATTLALALTLAVRPKIDRWSLACLVIPLAIYGAAAMTTHVNLGLRHVFPLYPLLFVLCGVSFARLGEIKPAAFSWLSAVVFVGLLAESLAAFPHYISFFNAPSRPFRLHLLGDSNFDWGQDLLDLAIWRRRHFSTPLYVAYFGTVDPSFYGIHGLGLPGNFVLSRDPAAAPDLGASVGEPGVLAVSASILQGVHQPPNVRQYYQPLLDRRPREIVGDTIYLYDWPLR